MESVDALVKQESEAAIETEKNKDPLTVEEIANQLNVWETEAK